MNPRMYRPRIVWVFILPVFAALAVAAGMLFGAHESEARADAFAVPVAPELRSWVADGMNPAAKEVIASGSITREQYVAAFDAHVACLNSEGLQLTSQKWENDRIAFEIGGFPTFAALQEAKPKIEACYAENFRGIDMAWQMGVKTYR